MEYSCLGAKNLLPIKARLALQPAEGGKTDETKSSIFAWWRSTQAKLELKEQNGVVPVFAKIHLRRTAKVQYGTSGETEFYCWQGYDLCLRISVGPELFVKNGSAKQEAHPAIEYASGSVVETTVGRLVTKTVRQCADMPAKFAGRGVFPPNTRCEGLSIIEVLEMIGKRIDHQITVVGFGSTSASHEHACCKNAGRYYFLNN